VDQLAKDLEHYLSEVTGLNISANPLNSGDMPYFFSRQYALYRLIVGRAAFTAVFLLQEDEFKPAQFNKHLAQVPSIEVDEACVVAHSLPTYVRKRMIEKGIAFVIPKVQMYLPSLGMELRPRPGRKKPVSVERFSPATQVVLIHCLLGRVQGAVSPLELSKQLRYSAMTMSRALDELESTQIAQVERVGRERLVTFTGDRRAIWQEAIPRLRNPISHTVRIIEHDLHQQDALRAGMTALSTRSMLSEPTNPEYAASRDTWKAMKKAGVENIPLEEHGTCLLQVWCYDPKVLKVDGQVDPFSLYLSLQNETDERIEMAIEEMMERFSW
jgi:hypothetical protein